MRRIVDRSVLITVFCLVSIGLLSTITRAQEPVRLKRAESFLGIHLDFHAGESDIGIGKNTTPEMVQALLDLIKPDYIQIDCKGHAGISSYPTKVGYPAPGIVGDPLKIYREVTAKNGVALYMHYSGVWDNKAVAVHPEWAAISTNGISKEMISVFGTYVDELLIPQLLELANDYGVDGAWVDGECWATISDYGDKAKAEFTAQTGITDIPLWMDSPNWFAWLDFHREAYREYMRYYLNVLHEKAPQFQVTSNWSFSDHMPEPVSAPVDYLSGDYTHSNAINAARFSSRFIGSQGVPWDLMAWSFSKQNESEPWSDKTVVALKREAACVLAQGGGFQAYYKQNRDGSVNLDSVKTMGEVAPFVRERQEVTQYSTPIHQVALVFPVEAHYRRVAQQTPQLFPWAADWQRGILQSLLENQYSVEIYNDAPLMEKIDQFPVVVFSQWETITPEFHQALVDYVQRGGNLLIVSEASAKLFATAFEKVDFNVCKPGNSGESFRTGSFGNGKIAVITNPISERYPNESETLRDFVGVAMASLFPDPLVRCTGTPFVDVSLRKTKNGEVAIHLVNCSGDHAHTAIITEIEPIGPLTITVHNESKPTSIKVIPGNKEIPFEYSNNQATFTIDKVDIYDVIVIHCL